MGRIGVGIAAGMLLASVASSALAGSSGTADVGCGSTSAGWNAPNGALVANRSQGPVRGVIDGIGEQRTHVMLSHGTIGWVSHASMFSPGSTGWPTYCDTPLKSGELQYGYPGPSQINSGAMYTYLYRNGSNEFVRYKSGIPCQAEQIANWLWNSSSYYTVYSRQDGGSYFYRINNNGALNYSLYQFKNTEGSPTGGYSANNGMVCSSFLAWSQYRGLSNTTAVTPYIYSQTQKYNAINALYSGVESSCSSGLGFWGGFGAGVTCVASIIYFDTSICDDAGRQVANCMSRNSCDSSSDGWESVRNDRFNPAIAISPDRMAGYSGHANLNDSSVWATGGDYDVAWNSPGNVYGCWF